MATTVLHPAAPAYRSRLYEWVTTTDHKKIGIMYLINSFIFFFIGGVLALGVRAELAQPGLQFLTDSTYNEFFTMHATFMIFLFIIPILAGFGNYIVPLQIGAPDVAFPRINALSLWMLPLAGILLILSFFTGGSAAAGWTSYAPLSEDRPLAAVGPGQDLWIVAVVFIGTSSILGAVNFLVTIFKLRAPGMTLFRMPIMVWTVLVTSVLVLLATPVITSALIMLFIDRNYGGSFFDPSNGGDAILYQNIFWFYSHPAVYIMVLPAMGMISEILPVFSRKPLFGYKAFVFATAGIGALGFSVWAHHMFTTGAVFLPFFSLMTFLIAVPTGVKMFNWIFTLWRGQAAAVDPAAVRARLPEHVPDRWHQRGDQRGRAGRLRAPRHLLGGVAPPLRAVRRFGLRRDGRAVLLVPEDDRSIAQRGARQDPVRADVPGLQPDVLPDAPARVVGNAAAHRRLRVDGRLERPEPRRDHRRLPDREQHDPVALERVHLAAQRQARRGRPVGGQHARVGDELAAAAVQLRPPARDPFRAAGVRRAPRSCDARRRGPGRGALIDGGR